MEDGYFQIIMTLFGMGITDGWKAYKFHLGNWHSHKQISIETFADLLCHDLLNNQFSSVTAEETTFLIPGTPPDGTCPADSGTTGLVLSTIQEVACNNSTVVSSLTQSKDSMASKLEILSHELTKMMESALQSDPTLGSCMRTKRYQCKACQNKLMFKCSKCIQTVALCNRTVCLDWHRLQILMGKCCLVSRWKNVFQMWGLFELEMSRG